MVHSIINNSFAKLNAFFLILLMLFIIPDSYSASASGREILHPEAVVVLEKVMTYNQYGQPTGWIDSDTTVFFTGRTGANENRESIYANNTVYIPKEAILRRDLSTLELTRKAIKPFTGTSTLSLIDPTLLSSHVVSAFAGDYESALTPYSTIGGVLPILRNGYLKWESAGILVEARVKKDNRRLSIEKVKIENKNVSIPLGLNIGNAAIKALERLGYPLTIMQKDSYIINGSRGEQLSIMINNQGLITAIYFVNKQPSIPSPLLQLPPSPLGRFISGTSDEYKDGNFTLYPDQMNGESEQTTIKTLSSTERRNKKDSSTIQEKYPVIDTIYDDTTRVLDGIYRLKQRKTRSEAMIDDNNTPQSLPFMNTVR